ncbi:hypothetical protein Pyrde_0324 [Pyrodictium delaneyi]|uniref:Uncharacterized protein n=1 Tax=Pyrodictium delaneyi TaxID=1273541 RepID=A0A0P0N0J8_9CREN|nr:hypothetical protein [Pyrodictium delaneyi]ALL00374.1 hypothetical protein Pyrde_0324 [Pyrodictium delaneyi]
MKIHKDLDKIAALLSCYDFRLEAQRIADHLGVSDQHVRSIVRKIRNIDKEELARHRRKSIAIIDYRALDLQSVTIVTKSIRDIIDFFDKVENKRTMNIWFRLDLPYNRYLISINKLFGGRLMFTYRLPKDLVSDLVHEFEKKFKDKIFIIDNGSALPVYNCTQAVARDLESIRFTYDAHSDMYNSVLDVVPIGSRMKLIDVIIVAMIEYYPLLKNIDLRAVNLLARARVEELNEKFSSDISFRFRFMKNHYDRLSKLRYVGRTWIGSFLHGTQGDIEAIMVITSRECAEQLYVFAAATLTGTQVFAGNEYAVTALLVNSEIKPLLGKFLEKYCSGKVLSESTIVYSRAVPMPVEMFDPWRNRWDTRPHDVAEALKKFRLVE